MTADDGAVCLSCLRNAVRTPHGNTICTGCGYFEERCLCD